MQYESSSEESFQAYLILRCEKIRDVLENEYIHARARVIARIVNEYKRKRAAELRIYAEKRKSCKCRSGAEHRLVRARVEAASRMMA